MTPKRGRPVKQFTPAMRYFVQLYLETDGRNASDCYRQAFPKVAETATAAQISKDCWALQQHRLVKPFIDAVKRAAEDRLRQVAVDYGVTKERISREMARLAFAATEDSEFGPGMPIRASDKRAALMDLARLHGYIIDRKDVRIINSFEDLTDDELEKLSGGRHLTVDGDAEEVAEDDEEVAGGRNETSVPDR